MVIPISMIGLSWDLCTSGKDGFHKASFSNCRIQALGGASHGCQEWFSSWRPARRDYMKHLEGYTSDPSLVCKLQKSLHGLKKAPWSWYAKMDAFPPSQNFRRCKYDPNVYLQQYDGNIMIIVLYVDDILITASTLASIAFIKLLFMMLLKWVIWAY